MAERRRLEKYAQRRAAPSIAEALARFTPGAAACGAEVGAAPRRELYALAANGGARGGFTERRGFAARTVNLRNGALFAPRR